VVFLVAEVSLVLFSVLAFGWFVFARLPETLLIGLGKKTVRIFRIFSLSLFVLLISSMFWYVWDNANWGTSVPERIAKVSLEFAVPAFVALYIHAMLTTSGVRRVFIAMILAMSLVIVSMIAKESLSRTVGGALRVFGAGGNTPIAFVFDGEEQQRLAYLVLMSPQFLHVRIPGVTKMTTIPIERLKKWSTVDVAFGDVYPFCRDGLTGACVDTRTNSVLFHPMAPSISGVKGP
jgi:hypothetical protein